MREEAVEGGMDVEMRQNRSKWPKMVEKRPKTDEKQSKTAKNGNK
jgi:hypothetical protein